MNPTIGLILCFLSTSAAVLAQSNLDDKAISSVSNPNIEQVFACRNCLSSTSGYHTGQDLASSSSNIYATGFGKVVVLQPNGEGCNLSCVATSLQNGGRGAGCGCLDHGLGNAAVLEHTLLDGSKTYSLYAHNASLAPGLAVGKCVAKGAVIATMGGTGYGRTDTWSAHSHLEFKTAGVIGAPDGSQNWGYTGDSPTLHGYLDPASYIGHLDIWDGTSENYRTPAGQVPAHPVGTLIRKRSDGTVYLIVDEHTIRGLTSANILTGLYANGGFGLESVLVISDEEFGIYQIGSPINSPLPTNNRIRPNGTLVTSPQGEISIVTSVNGTDGGRRPFPSAATFTGLGYSFCNAIQVSQDEYNTYSPVGPNVDGAPSTLVPPPPVDADITRLSNSTQQVAWFYVQNSVGRWFIVSPDSTSSVLALAGADRSFSGIIEWRPVSNAAAYASYSAAGQNFSAVTIASDGRSITFGSTTSSDSDVLSLTNRTLAVKWFYVQANSLWYIVDSAAGSNPAVLKLQDADPSYTGLILWKPISNYSSSVGAYPAATMHYSFVTVSANGRTVQFGLAQ